MNGANIAVSLSTGDIEISRLDTTISEVLLVGKATDIKELRKMRREEVPGGWQRIETKLSPT